MKTEKRWQSDVLFNPSQDHVHWSTKIFHCEEHAHVPNDNESLGY